VSAGSASAGPASAQRPAGSDDLRKIRGIGPGFARALHGIGIDKYAQIAAWTDEDIASVSARIGARPDRIRRDGWIESARALSERGSSGASAEPASPPSHGGGPEDR
jgi:predicted flap endonuclease-1-like 5' DNA nuclease